MNPDQHKKAMADFNAGRWTEASSLLEEQLITACLGNDDIEPRLRLADCYEERGDERAELIRLVREQQQGYLAPEWDAEKRKHCECRSCTRFRRIEELRCLCDKPFLAAIDAAWPKCKACDSTLLIQKPHLVGIHNLVGTCVFCNYTGRVGELCRKCPNCTNGYIPIGRFLPAGGFDHTCERCDGYGVLLEMDCPACFERGSSLMPNQEDVCDQCEGDDFVGSPLAPFWRHLVVTFDPRAEQVRRGDLKGIL